MQHNTGNPTNTISLKEDRTFRPEMRPTPMSAPYSTSDNINARDLKQTSLTWSRVDNLHCDDNVYG